MKKQSRKLNGQFAKEEPYSRIASLCGLILVIAGVGLIGLNLFRVEKKFDRNIIELDREMVEYTRQIVVSREQQAQADKALAEQATEIKKEIKQVKEEVEEIKATIGQTDKEKKVEIEIRKIAKEKNFKYPTYLVRLAYCESQLNPASINTEGNKPAGSRDRGLFQWNSYHQKQMSDKCAFSTDCSTRATIDKINAGGQGIWVCNDIVLNKK